jgi:hypothetical protein
MFRMQLPLERPVPKRVKTVDALKTLPVQLTHQEDAPHKLSTVPHSQDATRIRLAKYFKWKADTEHALDYTPVASAYYGENIYKFSEAEGLTMLKKIEQTVRSFFPNGRFPFQRDLHRQLTRATLRQILGKDYQRLVGRVCKENGWDGPKKNLFAIASRRSGKTTGMASYVAAMLLCIPNINIVVYSVALRTAAEFVRLVERYLMTSSAGKAMIKNPGGSEMLVLRGAEITDVRTIKSFPSGGNAQNVSRIFFLFAQ